MEEIKEKLSYREKANSTTRFSLPTIGNYFNIHGIIIIILYYYSIHQRTEWFFNIISFNIHNNSRSSNKWGDRFK